jgi:myo-inositol-1(or 4)-monophosphatase
MGHVSVRQKGRADFVTEADFASQEIVRRIVLGAFPDHLFVGEESPDAAGLPRPGAAAGYRWIVDPLDGTTNYVHQVPHFSISLALENAGQLLVGAIYDPVSDECFTAAAGEGAYLNGSPIHTSGATRASEALIAMGFPAVVTADSADLKVFLELAFVCEALRRMGSAALNLAYTAAGRFDACWSLSTKLWDSAAGALLVREAGGIVTDPGGSPFVLQTGHFLAAATPQLHADLRSLMQRAGV